MKIQLDFSELGKSNLIPAGQYNVVIDQIELRHSQKDPNGPGYLNWQFTITDGEERGRKTWGMSTLSSKGLWKTDEYFKVLGIDIRETGIETDEKTNLVVEPNVMGQTVVLVISWGKLDDGRDVTQIDRMVAMNEVPQGQFNL